MDKKGKSVSDMNYLVENRLPGLVEELVSELLTQRPAPHRVFKVIREMMTKAMDKRFYEWEDRVKSVAGKGDVAEIDLTQPFELKFFVPERSDANGYELKKNGSDISVTKENLEEFIELLNSPKAPVVVPLRASVLGVETREMDSPNSKLLDSSLLCKTVLCPENENPAFSYALLASLQQQLDVLLVNNFTDTEWSSLDLVWSAPCDGKWGDLIPNGGTTKVAHDDKFKFINMSKQAILDEESRVISGLRKTVSNDTEMFSPTHFDHDLFSPATGALKLIPQKLEEPREAPVEQMKNYLKDEHRNATMTKEQWDGFNLTWCTPGPHGELVDLIPNGRVVPVTFNEKEKYFAACDANSIEKEERPFSPTHFAKDLFSPNIKQTPEIPESPDKMFNDLKHDFMPIIKNMLQESYTQQEWDEMEITWSAFIQGIQVELIPNGIEKHVLLEDKIRYCKHAEAVINNAMRAPQGSTDMPLSPLSPNSLDRDFIDMVNELEKLEFDEEMWKEMNVTWCVSANSEIHDLLPQGRFIPVLLEDKLEYCSMAKNVLLQQMSHFQEIPVVRETSCVMNEISNDLATALFSPKGATPNQSTSDLKKSRSSIRRRVTHPPEPLDFGKKAAATETPFSPTHFQHDLFAPANPERKESLPVPRTPVHLYSQLAEYYVEQPLPPNLTFSISDPFTGDETELTAGGASICVSQHTFRTYIDLARQFYHKRWEEAGGQVLSPVSPMFEKSPAAFLKAVDAIAHLDCSVTEFQKLDITWCVPQESGLVDIIPNGRAIQVKYSEVGKWLISVRCLLHPPISEFLKEIQQTGLGALFETEEIMCLADLLELEEEDFVFIPKVVQRRKVLNGLKKYKRICP